MTLISQDAHARREAARDRGRFGEQHHTPPELTIRSELPELHDLWDERQAAAATIAETDVALIASKLPKSAGGVRFTVREGQLVPSQLLPANPATDVTPEPEFAPYLELLTAYAQNRNRAVELEPVHDGTDSFDWVPGDAARAVSVTDADAANQHARQRFASAAYDLNIASERYLSTRMPDGITAVDVVYLDGDGAVLGYVYDEDGVPAAVNLGSEEWTDYRLIASRAPDTVHRIGDARRSDIYGIHFHIQRGQV